MFVLDLTQQMARSKSPAFLLHNSSCKSQRSSFLATRHNPNKSNIAQDNVVHHRPIVTSLVSRNPCKKPRPQDHPYTLAVSHVGCESCSSSGKRGICQSSNFINAKFFQQHTHAIRISFFHSVTVCPVIRRLSSLETDHQSLTSRQTLDNDAFIL